MTRSTPSRSSACTRFREPGGPVHHHRRLAGEQRGQVEQPGADRRRQHHAHVAPRQLADLGHHQQQAEHEPPVSHLAADLVREDQLARPARGLRQEDLRDGRPGRNDSSTRSPPSASHAGLGGFSADSIAEMPLPDAARTTSPTVTRLSGVPAGNPNSFSIHSTSSARCQAVEAEVLGQSIGERHLAAPGQSRQLVDHDPARRLGHLRGIARRPVDLGFRPLLHAALLPEAGTARRCSAARARCRTPRDTR